MEKTGCLELRCIRHNHATLGDPRVQGGLMFTGGIMGMFGGAALWLVPDPTFLTKIGGTALLGLSADSAATGLEQLRSNQGTQTLTSQGLQSVGVPPYYANMVSGLAEIVLVGAPIGIVRKVGAAGRQLITPSTYFGSKTAQEISAMMAQKFGPPKSVREGAETFYNPKTQRSFNVHTDPTHGSPHVDVRRRGGYPERKYPLAEGEL